MNVYNVVFKLTSQETSDVHYEMMAINPLYIVYVIHGGINAYRVELRVFLNECTNTLKIAQPSF